MEREQKRMMALGMLIILIIIASVLYFLWGSFIDSGSLSVIGNAPFEVKVFNDKAYQCPASPCKIRQKTGLKDLIIEKSGYKTFLTESEIKLWRTTSLYISFEIIPVLEKIEKLPPIPEEITYELVGDENNSQKLIEAGDVRKTALAYFPNSFKKPRIFGGKNKVLIIDQNQIYLVDTRLSKKEKIEDQDFEKIKSAKLSPNGKYIVFERDGDDNLWLINAKERTNWQLPIITPINSVSWDENGNLIFVTEQAYENGNEGKINLFSEKLPGNFLFSVYRPEENSYYDKAAFTEIETTPTELLFTPDEKYLYFKSGEEAFRVIMSSK